MEKVIDGLSDAFAHVGHILQIFDGSRADFFKSAEMLGDVPCAGAAYKTDAETVEQVFQTPFLGGGDGVKDVFGAFLYIVVK